MYATQTVIRQCVEPGMLILHQGQAWRAAVNANGKLHIHRAMERAQLKVLTVELIIDREKNPVKEAS